jgi:HK97 family phage major capsid protein
MNKVIELRRQKADLLAQAQAIHEANESLSEEQRAEFDALMVQVDEANAAIEREERMAVAGGRAGGSMVQAQNAGAAAVHNRRTPDTEEGIYCRWVRSGDAGAQREMMEMRASNDTTMNVTTAADGGDLVPVGHYNQIVERLRPQALHEQLGVRMIPGSQLTVNVPIDNEADSGEFVSTAESAAFDRDAPAVTKKAMTLVKYTKKVDLTFELLQGEDAQLLAFLARYVADGMAATLNKLLVTKALADGTAALTLDATTAIGAAEVPELLYKLPARYAMGPDVSWLMRRATEGYLRGLTGDSFLFSPTPGGGGVGNYGANLLGLPQFSDDNMGAMTATGKSLLVGNWGYMGMRLDPALTVLRDPYTRSGYGEVVMNYYFMAVFEVLQAGALVYATQAAS